MKEYKIIERVKNNNVWENERFLTGGLYYYFKEGQKILKELKKMSSSIDYKLIKDDYYK